MTCRIYNHFTSQASRPLPWRPRRVLAAHRAGRGRGRCKDGAGSRSKGHLHTGWTHRKHCNMCRFSSCASLMARGPCRSGVSPWWSWVRASWGRVRGRCSYTSPGTRRSCTTTAAAPLPTNLPREGSCGRPRPPRRNMKKGGLWAVQCGLASPTERLRETLR